MKEKPKKDWKDIRSAILTCLLIVFLPVTGIAAIILKIKNELRFWDWLLHGMPEVPHRWYYVLTLIGSVIGFALCVMYAGNIFMSTTAEKEKQPPEEIKGKNRNSE